MTIDSIKEKTGIDLNEQLANIAIEIGKSIKEDFYLPKELFQNADIIEKEFERHGKSYGFSNFNVKVAEKMEWFVDADGKKRITPVRIFKDRKKNVVHIHYDFLNKLVNLGLDSISKFIKEELEELKIILGNMRQEKISFT